MNLRIYNTPDNQVVDFKPLNPKEVKIYVCGATVQDSPHIGHLRAAVAFDVFRRFLLSQDYKVTLVRNVTDIDDKVLDKAKLNNQDWWARAYFYELEFTKAYNLLNVLPPTYEPRATGTIPEMIAFIQRLLDRDHAYLGKDGVYFDVQSWPQYGELTHQYDSSNLLTDTDVAEGKKDPRDFALWKFSKANEPETAKWDAPFGQGRPGWHIECSTMSQKYLGDNFDIHGGGLDLRFPHHENETAQSHAAGYPFANYWMHSAWVTQAGEKMSKSIGNVLGVDYVLSELTLLELRFALASVHYRKNIEWSEVHIENAKKNLATFTKFLESFNFSDDEISDDALAKVKLPDEVIEAFNDDLNLSKVLEWIFTTISQNSSPNSSQSKTDRSQALQVIKVLDILGANPLSPIWTQNSKANSEEISQLEKTIETLTKPKLEQRDLARKNKDFATSDQIRDELQALGLEIIDTPSGSKINIS